MNIRTKAQFREYATTEGLIYRSGRQSPVLRMYEDGTILRTDVRLDLAKPLTLREAVGVATNWGKTYPIKPIQSLENRLDTNQSGN